MNINGHAKSKSVNFRTILGGIPGLLDDGDYERESPAIAPITQTVKEAAIGLFQNIAGVEPKKESNGAAKFPTTGSIEFSNNQAKAKQSEQQNTQQDKEIVRKKAFFQALKEDQERAQREKDRLLFEEEINDIITNLPTVQKNQLLHYQAGYKDRSIYQRAELRKKLIEEKRKAEKQEKEAAIPSPAKQPSALEGAFEGRSGQQGSGMANLSAHATG